MGTNHRVYSKIPNAKYRKNQLLDNPDFIPNGGLTKAEKNNGTEEYLNDLIYFLKRTNDDRIKCESEVAEEISSKGYIGGERIS